MILSCKVYDYYSTRLLTEAEQRLDKLLARPPVYTKTKLKVSGCFRTEAGVQNGQNPFEVLRVIATLALT